MNICKIFHKPNTCIAAVVMLTVALIAVAAQDRGVHTPFAPKVSAAVAEDPVRTAAPAADSRLIDRCRKVYAEAARCIDSKRCLPLADSLYSMGRQLGNVDIQLSALSIPVKYNCRQPDNLDAIDRALDPYMRLALAHRQLEHFYSGVSFRTTYLTNCKRYTDALDYQTRMIKYARAHNHTYGIIVGLVSLGNMYRVRLQMAQAIDAYTQVLDMYRKYPSKMHDMGLDYKRLAECYLISYDFGKALEAENAGIRLSKYDPSVSGLLCYRAFTLFMLDRDTEFIDSYNRYRAFGGVRPDVHPYVQNSVEVMKHIYDGDYAAADTLMTPTRLGAYMRYVEIAYNKRLGRYRNVLEALRHYNVLAYGESGGAFAPDFMQMNSEVTNNIADIERQRAANENSRLELTRTNLQLENTQLELIHSRDAEHLALTTAEAQRLSYNNQRLLARQLGDSLANQRLMRGAREQKAATDRTRFVMLLGAMLVVTAVSALYLRRNSKLTGQLKRTNSDLQHTLDSLSAATAEAMESDRKKTEFVQNMSHEIRTPLNAIVGFSQVLTDSAETLGEDERKQMAGIINSNSELLNTLVNDILELTSLESGKYKLKSETVCVNELCHRALDATRSRKAEGVHLRLETELPDSFELHTDGCRVAQVIVNMLTNAMKNTERGSIVLQCSLAERPGALTFAVADTGCGVPPDKRRQIFDRFCKLDQFKQGVGLGLDICRIIARKLGGAIDIDPTYTGGARFWFAIPLDRQAD